jgi:hypothetical protein
VSGPALPPWLHARLASSAAAMQARGEPLSAPLLSRRAGVPRRLAAAFLRAR